MTNNCPRCDSPEPRLHPAVQEGGEVSICPDPYHTPPVVITTEDIIASLVTKAECDDMIADLMSQRDEAQMYIEMATRRREEIRRKEMLDVETKQA